VHGNEESIREIEKRTPAQVESMEGAAFLYACRLENVPCMQIRAISNYVEKRNRSKWKIELAQSNLAEACHKILNSI
jgi:futalosine hydrolase